MKLRYDLMNLNSKLDEVIIDHQNILNLKNGEKVKSVPRVSKKGERIVYLT